MGLVNPFHVEPRYKCFIFALYAISILGLSAFLGLQIFLACSAQSIRYAEHLGSGTMPDIGFCPGPGSSLRYAFYTVELKFNGELKNVTPPNPSLIRLSGADQTEPCIRFELSALPPQVGHRNQQNALNVRILFLFEREFNETFAAQNALAGMIYTDIYMRASEGGEIVGFLGPAVANPNKPLPYKQITTELHKEVIRFENGKQQNSYRTSSKAWQVYKFTPPRNMRHFEFPPQDKDFVSSVKSPNDDSLEAVDMSFLYQWTGSRPSVGEHVRIPLAEVLLDRVGNIGGLIGLLGMFMGALFPRKHDKSRIAVTYHTRTLVGSESPEWEPEVEKGLE